MNYKNNISDKVKSGALSTAGLSHPEIRLFFESLTQEMPFSIKGLNVFFRLVKSSENYTCFNDLLAAIKHRVKSDQAMNAESVLFIQRILHSFEIQPISRDIANFLFDLNELVANSEDNHHSWGDLFTSSLSRHLLENGANPNEIEDADADWLIERILSDGQYDYVEQQLLPTLGKSAKKMPDSLRSQIDLLNG
jgi:hypothetical protein